MSQARRITPEIESDIVAARNAFVDLAEQAARIAVENGCRVALAARLAPLLAEATPAPPSPPAANVVAPAKPEPRANGAAAHLKPKMAGARPAREATSTERKMELANWLTACRSISRHKLDPAERRAIDVFRETISAELEATP